MSAAEPSRAVECHLAVTKTARYWTLGDPVADNSEIWFVLHGYKQLARRFLRRFAAVASEARLVVAPEALSRFYVSPEPGRHDGQSVVGATWMTREDRLNEIEDYVAYLDRLAEELGAASHPVTVLGFSQGVATAARWVVHGAIQPERLILWGDLMPPDLDVGRAAEALSGVSISLVRGEEDSAFDPGRVAAEAKQLASARIAHEVVTYRGGHDIDAQTLGRLVGA